MKQTKKNKIKKVLLMALTSISVFGTLTLLSGMSSSNVNKEKEEDKYKKDLKENIKKQLKHNSIYSDKLDVEKVLYKTLEGNSDTSTYLKQYIKTYFKSKVFENILLHQNKVKPLTYDELIKLRKEIFSMYNLWNENTKDASWEKLGDTEKGLIEKVLTTANQNYKLSNENLYNNRTLSKFHNVLNKYFNTANFKDLNNDLYKYFDTKNLYINGKWNQANSEVDYKELIAWLPFFFKSKNNDFYNKTMWKDFFEKNQNYSIDAARSLYDKYLETYNNSNIFYFSLSSLQFNNLFEKVLRSEYGFNVWKAVLSKYNDILDFFKNISVEDINYYTPHSIHIGTVFNSNEVSVMKKWINSEPLMKFGLILATIKYDILDKLDSYGMLEEIPQGTNTTEIKYLKNQKARLQEFRNKNTNTPDETYGFYELYQILGDLFFIKDKDELKKGMGKEKEEEFVNGALNKPQNFINENLINKKIEIKYAGKLLSLTSKTYNTNALYNLLFKGLGNFPTIFTTYDNNLEANWLEIVALTHKFKHLKLNSIPQEVESQLTGNSSILFEPEDVEEWYNKTSKMLEENTSYLSSFNTSSFDITLEEFKAQGFDKEEDLVVSGKDIKNILNGLTNIYGNSDTTSIDSNSSYTFAQALELITNIFANNQHITNDKIVELFEPVLFPLYASELKTLTEQSIEEYILNGEQSQFNLIKKQNNFTLLQDIYETLKFYQLNSSVMSEIGVEKFNAIWKDDKIKNGIKVVGDLIISTALTATGIGAATKALKGGQIAIKAGNAIMKVSYKTALKLGKAGSKAIMKTAIKAALKQTFMTSLKGANKFVKGAKIALLGAKYGYIASKPGLYAYRNYANAVSNEEPDYSQGKISNAGVFALNFLCEGLGDLINDKVSEDTKKINAKLASLKYEMSTKEWKRLQDIINFQLSYNEKIERIAYIRSILDESLSLVIEENGQRIDMLEEWMNDPTFQGLSDKAKYDYIQKKLEDFIETSKTNATYKFVKKNTLSELVRKNIVRQMLMDQGLNVSDSFEENALTLLKYYYQDIAKYYDMNLDNISSYKDILAINDIQISFLQTAIAKVMNSNKLHTLINEGDNISFNSMLANTLTDENLMDFEQIAATTIKNKPHKSFWAGWRFWETIANLFKETEGLNRHEYSQRLNLLELIKIKTYKKEEDINTNPVNQKDAGYSIIEKPKNSLDNIEIVNNQNDYLVKMIFRNGKAKLNNIDGLTDFNSYQKYYYTLPYSTKKEKFYVSSISNLNKYDDISKIDTTKEIFVYSETIHSQLVSNDVFYRKEINFNNDIKQFIYNNQNLANDMILKDLRIKWAFNETDYNVLEKEVNNVYNKIEEINSHIKRLNDLKVSYENILTFLKSTYPEHTFINNKIVYALNKSQAQLFNKSKLVLSLEVISTVGALEYKNISFDGTYYNFDLENKEYNDINSIFSDLENNDTNSNHIQTLKYNGKNLIKHNKIWKEKSYETGLLVEPNAVIELSTKYGSRARINIINLYNNFFNKKSNDIDATIPANNYGIKFASPYLNVDLLLEKFGKNKLKDLNYAQLQYVKENEKLFFNEWKTLFEYNSANKIGNAPSYRNFEKLYTGIVENEDYVLKNAEDKKNSFITSYIYNHNSIRKIITLPANIKSLNLIEGKYRILSVSETKEKIVDERNIDSNDNTITFKDNGIYKIEKLNENGEVEAYIYVYLPIEGSNGLYNYDFLSISNVFKDYQLYKEDILYKNLLFRNKDKTYDVKNEWYIEKIKQINQNIAHNNYIYTQFYKVVEQVKQLSKDNSSIAEKLSQLSTQLISLETDLDTSKEQYETLLEFITYYYQVLKDLPYDYNNSNDKYIEIINAIKAKNLNILKNTDNSKLLSSLNENENVLKSENTYNYYQSQIYDKTYYSYIDKMKQYLDFYFNEDYRNNMTSDAKPSYLWKDETFLNYVFENVEDKKQAYIDRINSYLEDTNKIKYDNVETKIINLEYKNNLYYIYKKNGIIKKTKLIENEFNELKDKKHIYMSVNNNNNNIYKYDINDFAFDFSTNKVILKTDTKNYQEHLIFEHYLKDNGDLYITSEEELKKLIEKLINAYSPSIKQEIFSDDDLEAIKKTISKYLVNYKEIDRLQNEYNETFSKINEELKEKTRDYLLVSKTYNYLNKSKKALEKQLHTQEQLIDKHLAYLKQQEQSVITYIKNTYNLKEFSLFNDNETKHITDITSLDKLKAYEHIIQSLKYENDLEKYNALYLAEYINTKTSYKTLEEMLNDLGIKINNYDKSKWVNLSISYKASVYKNEIRIRINDYLLTLNLSNNSGSFNFNLASQDNLKDTSSTNLSSGWVENLTHQNIFEIEETGSNDYEITDAAKTLEEIEQIFNIKFSSKLKEKYVWDFSFRNNVLTLKNITQDKDKQLWYKYNFATKVLESNEINKSLTFNTIETNKIIYDIPNESVLKNNQNYQDLIYNNECSNPDIWEYLGINHTFNDLNKIDKSLYSYTFNVRYLSSQYVYFEIIMSYQNKLFKTYTFRINNILDNYENERFKELNEYDKPIETLRDLLEYNEFHRYKIVNKGVNMSPEERQMLLIREVIAAILTENEYLNEYIDKDNHTSIVNKNANLDTAIDIVIKLIFKSTNENYYKAILKGLDFKTMYNSLINAIHFIPNKTNLEILKSNKEEDKEKQEELKKIYKENPYYKKYFSYNKPLFSSKKIKISYLDVAKKSNEKNSYIASLDLPYSPYNKYDNKIKWVKWEERYNKFVISEEESEIDIASLTNQQIEELEQLLRIINMYATYSLDYKDKKAHQYVPLKFNIEVNNTISKIKYGFYAHNPNKTILEVWEKNGVLFYRDYNGVYQVPKDQTLEEFMKDKKLDKISDNFGLIKNKYAKQLLPKTSEKDKEVLNALNETQILEYENLMRNQKIKPYNAKKEQTKTMLILVGISLLTMGLGYLIYRIIKIKK